MPSKGLVGIQNLGETCFINVILQLFSNITEIRKFFLSSIYQEDSNYELNLSTTLENIIKKLWEIDNTNISISNLYEILKQQMPNFANNQQHDAHEFLLNLIDKIYPDASVSIKVDSSPKPFQKINIFKENLFGILRNTIICPDCKTKKIKFEPFLSLNLPIPNNMHNLDNNNSESFEEFWRTYYISDDIESNHRVICLNIPLPEKKLKTMSLSQYKEFIKKEIKTLEKNDIVMVASNEKIIWKMYEDEKEKIYEIYSQARKENLTLSFIELIPEVALAPNSFIIFISFTILMKNQELEKELFLTLPRFLCLNKEKGLQNQLELYVNNLLKKIFNEKIESDKPYNGFYEMKIRLFNLFGNIENVDVCENCQKNICNCKSFKSDEYFLEQEQKYENSNYKLFVKIVFHANRFSSQQLENLQILKKSIKYDEQKEIDLSDCFNEFTKIEILNEENKWFCQKCNQTKQGINQLNLFAVPKILIIQLKRFITINLIKKKIHAKIKFPFENFNLSKFVKYKEESGNLYKREDVISNFNESLLKISSDNEEIENNEEVLYNLLGVINHVGSSLEKGHYYAYFHNEKDEFWYKFDDRTVSQEIEDEICSRESYILIYRRKEKA